MNDFIQKTIKNKTIMAVLSIILGVYLILRRAAAVTDIIHVIGILILIAGIINLITWFANKEDRNSASLAMAVLCAIVGLIFMAAPRWLVGIFPVVVGLVLIVNSVSNITGLARSDSIGAAHSTSLLMAVLSLILGIVLLFHPAAIANIIIAVAGVTFLINGISDLMLVTSAKH